MRVLVVYLSIVWVIRAQNGSRGAIQNCIENGYHTTCMDSACFMSSIRTEEGSVLRFGCLSSLDSNHSLTCQEQLKTTPKMCVSKEDGNEMCCCDASSFGKSLCNEQWMPHSPWPQISPREMLILCLSILAAFFIALVLRRVVEKTPERQLSDEIRQKLKNLELLVAYISNGLLAVSFVCLFYPIRKTCMQHLQGDFFPSSTFMFHILPNYYSAAALVPFTVVFMVLDANRLQLVWLGFPHDVYAPSIIQLSLCVPFVVILALFSLDLTHLAKIEYGKGYCKLGGSLAQLVVFGIASFFYVLLSLARESLLFSLMRKNKTFLQKQSFLVSDVPLDPSHRTTMGTALSNTTIKEDQFLDIGPKPFVMDHGEGVVTLINRHPTQWVALRILASSPTRYTVHPSKMVLPPNRGATSSIRYNGDVNDAPGLQGLMFQWFPVGGDCPSMAALPEAP